MLREGKGSIISQLKHLIEEVSTDPRMLKWNHLIWSWMNYNF